MEVALRFGWIDSTGRPEYAMHMLQTLIDDTRKGRRQPGWDDGGRRQPGWDDGGRRQPGWDDGGRLLGY